MIQIPQHCKYYRQMENMNLTCTYKGITKMCKIYYDEVCKEYKEKEDEGNLNNTTNSD